jgi:hypothetical protein
MYSSVSQLFTQNISSTGPLLGAARLALALTLMFFAVKPSARALLPPPPPDGGYPNHNTAEGMNALFSLTTGKENTAIGFEALFANNSGSQNTATGFSALFNNTDGRDNTANGAVALFSNGTGDSNTATGVEALVHNTTGNQNTATGVSALAFNKGGGGNTANGYQALYLNMSGSFNVANGYRALYNNVTGFWNIATGYQALQNNQSGSFNIALGVNAGSAITGSSNIDIGNVGVAGESGRIRIGTKGTHTGTFIAGISGVAVTGSTVVVNPNGKLGIATSSARFKKAIKPMDEASEAIHQLEPVTFRYKEEIDPNSIPQFGLIAEEVEKVNSDLVIRGEDGKVMSVRYEAVNAMLLNEFLKEHRKVEEQQATIAQMNKRIEILAATVQEVSAQIDLRKSVK